MDFKINLNDINVIDDINDINDINMASLIEQGDLANVRE
jgi:hypothetical protein